MKYSTGKEDFTLPPLFPWESNRLQWSLMDSNGLPWDPRWHRDKPIPAVSQDYIPTLLLIFGHNTSESHGTAP